MNTFRLPYLLAKRCDNIIPIRPARIPPPFNTPNPNEVSFSKVGRKRLNG